MGYENNSIFWVEVNKIVPNPFQPRREFNEDKLKELSESIRMYGILQPLTVTRNEITDEYGAFKTEYELVAGERRLRASRLAGLEQVPVIIRTGEESELMKLELAIIENLQREDLNAVDRALAFKQLADQFELSHTQVAKKVGRSRMYVSNTIRLLALPEYMLESLKQGDISEGHARTLLMLNDRPEEQDTIFREILLKKISVREVERLARKVAQDKVRKQKWKDTDPELIAKEQEFTDALGTRVQIAKTDYGGKITIDYFSEEDLTKLLAMMKTGEFVARHSDTETTRQSADLSDATPLESAADSTETPALPKEPVPEELAREVAEIREQAAKEREGEHLVHVDDRVGLHEEMSAVIDMETESGALAEEAVGQESTESTIETPAVTPADDLSPATESAESVITPPNPTVPADDPVQQPEEKKADDDQLYSLKNFSI